MTREEKILLVIEKGYTCDPVSGKVYGVYGKEITAKTPKGYMYISIVKDKKHYHLLTHQFIWYWVHKEVVDCIDHINGIKTDNIIDNLRSVTNQQNLYNTKAKGYTWDKSRNKWRAQIRIDGKKKNLGRFDTEQQAHKAYLNAKKIHHII
jgi:hypothetical protein